MSPLLLLALTTSQAQAACATHGGPGIDGDGDGWCLNDTPMDCKDGTFGAGINPGEAEDGIDATDQDCDDSPAVRRDYVMPFTNLGEFNTNRASIVGGAASLSPVSADPAWVKRKNTFTFESGAMYVGISLKPFASPTCTLVVDSSSSLATSYPLASGVQQVAVTSVRAGDTVNRLEVWCTGSSGAKAEIDWLTVQNGPYEWAPMRDLRMSSSTMAYPSTGRQNVVRVSEDYDGTAGILMAGSDVGGFAWTYPHDPDCEGGACEPTAWYTANGTATSGLMDAEDYAVWEVYAEPYTSSFGYEVLMLTGSQTHGGLWRSTSLAGEDSWTLVDGGLSAFKHYDDCPGHTGKEISSGRLIVEYPSYPAWTLVASGDDADRGVFFWRSGLTADDDVYVNLPSDDGGAYEALPSALATHLLTDEAEPNDPKEALLVGYRPIVTTAQGFDDNALYLCPADFDPASASGVECVPVVDSVDGDLLRDVRDIEVSPLWAGQFFVADGGRSYDGDSTCDYGESTVYIVEAWINSAGDYEFDVRDTDVAPDPMATPVGPSWNAGDDYYHANACQGPLAADTYGDLVAPVSGGDDEAYSLSTITFEPSTGFLFGFYPLGEKSREYGCVHMFRANMDAPNPDGTLAWRPFQDYEFADMDHEDSPHAIARRAQVDPRQGFMEDEPLLEVWAPGAVHDAVFVETANGYPNLLMGGNFHWWAFPDSDTSLTSNVDVGWDSPAHVSSDAACGTVNDLDCADFALAWGGDASEPVFQDTSANSIAVRPAAATLKGVDEIIAGGTGDYKMGVLYGGSATSRQPADRPCESHMMLSQGWLVSTWTPPSGGAAQAWMAMHQQGGMGDPALRRGLLFGDEGAIGNLGMEWCWDAVSEPDNTAGTGLAGTNFLFDDVSFDWGLTCHDSDMSSHQWYPCDTATDPWNMGDADIGVPRGLAAIGQDTAVLVTSPAYLPDGSGGLALDPDAAGLWLVEWTGATGLAYTKVDFHPDATITDNCDASEFFQYDGTFNARNRLAFDPTSSLSGDIRVFVNSRQADCGLYQVEFTKADPTNATWTKLLYSGVPSACTLAVGSLEGSTVSPDGEWVLAWGNDGNGDTTYTGGVCAIDLVSGTGTTMAVPGSAANNAIWTLVAHPHVEDTWHYGLLQENTLCTNCTAPGVYSLERRYNADTSAWEWASVRLSGNDLEHRKVVDLDWGPGTASVAPEVRHLYVTTSGGGFWDGSVSW